MTKNQKDILIALALTLAAITLYYLTAGSTIAALILILIACASCLIKTRTRLRPAATPRCQDLPDEV